MSVWRLRGRLGLVAGLAVRFVTRAKIAPMQLLSLRPFPSNVAWLLALSRVIGKDRKHSGRT